MNKKIIAIGITSMFLLTGASTLSVGTEDAVDINDGNESKLVAELISKLDVNVIPVQTKQ